jgi:hypothetical protein
VIVPLVPGVGHVGIVESPLEAVLLWMELGAVEGEFLRLQGGDELQPVLHSHEQRAWPLDEGGQDAKCVEEDIACGWREGRIPDQ